jgi:hypothetical protein
MMHCPFKSVAWMTSHPHDAVGFAVPLIIGSVHIAHFLQSVPLPCFAYDETDFLYRRRTNLTFQRDVSAAGVPSPTTTSKDIGKFNGFFKMKSISTGIVLLRGHVLNNLQCLRLL